MDKDAKVVKKRLVEHYDADARKYTDVNYGGRTAYSPLEFRQKYIEQMVEQLGLRPGAKILDVGCGPGELALELTRKGNKVWGVDISQGMITIAQELYSRNGLPPDQLAVGDIERLQFENGFFDVVIASGVLEYQRTDSPALTEMGRVLVPGGHMILNVSSRFAYVNWIDHPYRWLKKRPGARAVIAFLKQRVLGRGPLYDLPERRTHTLSGFDSELEQHGFKKVGEKFFHFSPLPRPLDSAFGGLAKAVGKQMEGLNDSSIGRLLGGGYIVVAQKKG